MTKEGETISFWIGFHRFLALVESCSFCDKKGSQVKRGTLDEKDFITKKKTLQPPKKSSNVMVIRFAAMTGTRKYCIAWRRPTACAFI